MHEAAPESICWPSDKTDCNVMWCAMMNVSMGVVQDRGGAPVGGHV